MKHVSLTSIDPLMKHYLVGVCIVGVVLSGLGFILAGSISRNQSDGVQNRSDSPAVDQISIDKGCDTGSGYIWCEPKQVCLRLYEEKCEGTVVASGSATPISQPATTP